MKGFITSAVFACGVVCLLAGTSPALAKKCPKGSTAIMNEACLPNASKSYQSTDAKPSTPSDETTVKPRYKPVKKLGVHHCPGEVVNGVCFF